MARRSNFIEGNDNFREQNLRFVRNEFEDNINQFFGGANPGGGTSQQKPPPRDSLIVQPTPEGAPFDPSKPPGRNSELDVRRQFFREVGASRKTAHALAVHSLNVKDFDLRYFQRQRFRLSVELGDSRQHIVDAEVLRAIEHAVENKEPAFESPPRTPSPPRNIDWHNVNRDSSPVRNDDRSRPRNRQAASGNFRGIGDNSREFVEHLGPERDQEPFNRNAGPKSGPNNRYNRNPNSDNRNASDEFNRNNRNANPQEINRNNRNANPLELNRNNRNSDEFNRNNRNGDEFNRNNRNSDEFNRNNRNANPQQEFHRNPQMEFNQNIRNGNPEIIRNNRIVVNPQTPQRNPNTQESYRNNRNDEFNRNVNWQEMNRNTRQASPQDFNRNPQEFNRNMNPQEFNRNMNPQELNRNMNPQGNRNLPLNPREVRGTQLNRRVMPPNFNNLGANPVANYRPLLPNPPEMRQNFNNLRANNNREPAHHGPGNNDFMPDQQEEDIDGTPIIDDNFLELRERRQQPQPSSYSDFRQMNRNVAEQGGGPPQIGHNYQRIVNDNKITICRQDWIEAKRMELENRNRPNNPNHNDIYRNQRSRQFEDQGEGYNDGPIMEDDDRFRRQQDDLRRPGFRSAEDQGYRNHSNNYDRNFESNPGNIIVHRNNDPNYHGRGRNVDRNERRHFNADDYDDDRAQSNDSVTFRGSRKPDISPNHQRHQRGSGPGDRYHGDHHPQPANPNQNRSNKGRNAANPRQTAAASPDRTMARNSNSSGRNPGSTSRASPDRNPGRNTTTGGSRTNLDRNPRSTSLASQNRNPSEGGKDRSASRSLKPGDASLKKPTQAGQEQLPSVSHKNCVSTQSKSEAKSDAKTSTFKQAQANASWENARAGQKRKAEAKESESSRSSKVETKRKRMTASQPSFIIAGIRLPYINSNKGKLPQSEDESYAVTFFEQAPLYNTNIYALDDGQSVDDADEVVSDAESIDSNQSESRGGNKPKSKQIIRNKLRREWMAIYRENNYKDWYAWWKDYKWCGTEINKELDKHGDRKMRHRFMPKYASTEILVREIFRCGRNGLKKNLYNHYRNMKSIFLVMNETFLEALSEEENEKLQDLIRYIPNHLWLYKVRSMVYLWERYHRILKTLDESKVHKENELSAIAREWRDPLFHWLAKQAFDELKAISGVAWPEHKRLYHGLI